MPKRTVAARGGASTTTAPSMALAGLAGLAKKMKEKEIATLRSDAEDENHPVAKAMKARGTKVAH